MRILVIFTLAGFGRLQRKFSQESDINKCQTHLLQHGFVRPSLHVMLRGDKKREYKVHKVCPEIYFSLFLFFFFFFFFSFLFFSLFPLLFLLFLEQTAASPENRVRRKRSRPNPTFCKLAIPLVDRPIVSDRDSIRDLQRGTACRNAYNLVGRSGSRSLDSRLRDVPRNKSDSLS